MIDFEEELAKFKPSKEVGQAEEAIISDSISPLDMCVEMILKSEGVDPGKLSMEGKSPAEVLAEAKITALDLTGCTYKQAMAFLEKGGFRLFSYIKG